MLFLLQVDHQKVTDFLVQLIFNGEMTGERIAWIVGIGASTVSATYFGVRRYLSHSVVAKVNADDSATVEHTYIVEDRD